jgi:cytochrome c553
MRILSRRHPVLTEIKVSAQRRNHSSQIRKEISMKSIFLPLSGFSLLLLCWGGPSVAQPAQPALSPELIQSCEACHGKGGDSRQPDVPRLNGQQKSYLALRLKEFLDPTRGTPHSNRMMWQNASRISDAQADALADYFSRQAPTPAIGFGPQADKGAEIFQHGDKPDIAACATCHGPKGEGLGDTPRLAGQKEDYLVEQLQAFSLTARVADPMNHHAWDMNTDQIRAVSAYLSHN